MKYSIFYLLCLLSLTSGCFVNYPIYYDDIIKTEKSLSAFTLFAKEKGICYKSSFGSTRQMGLVSSSMIPVESYGDIFEDQIPGKAGIDVQKANYSALPFDFWGARTGDRPFFIKGRLIKKSKKAIIIIHGILFSKRTYFVKEFAEMAAKFNFSVITIDLRGHGESLTYPETSGGIYEAVDVCYVAKKLKIDYGMEYVGVIGFSYGAHTAIRAAYESSWESVRSQGHPVIDAAIAISGPCDMHLAFEDLEPTGFGHLNNNFFDGLLSERVANLKAYGFVPKNIEIKSFKDYLEKRVIPYYKRTTRGAFEPNPSLDREEYKYLNRKVQIYNRYFQEKIGNADDLLKIASTPQLLPQITIPLLIIHAEDDVTVSVKHAEIIATTVNKNKLDNILVMIVPDGGHIAIHKIDPNWTFNIVYGFHYYHAFPHERNQFKTIDSVSSLWYYFDRVFDIRSLRLLWAVF